MNKQAAPAQHRGIQGIHREFQALGFNYSGVFLDSFNIQYCNKVLNISICGCRKCQNNPNDEKRPR